MTRRAKNDLYARAVFNPRSHRNASLPMLQSPRRLTVPEYDLRLLTQSRAFTAAALLILCLFTYLPGALLLPPIDRSEVTYAHTSHDMVVDGTWLDPRYGGEVKPRRPIGTHWAQGASAWISGSDALWMPIYRIPSLLALTAATLAIFLLTAPLVGSAQARIAAALFAVAPLTVLVATLAIADGLALLCGTVALLSLLRIYTAEADEPTRGHGLLFWSALGVGMLVNALQVPILVAVIVTAIVAFDRDVSWLRRTHALAGIPIALALASPWLVVRALQDGGIPYGNLPFHETIDALMGSQDMELKAYPGTFVLVPLLGFLPGLAVIADAARHLWAGRNGKVQRFLLCWIIAWIVFLEMTSGKPATYSVQFVFPAFALAAAALIVNSGLTPRTLRWSLILPVPAAIVVFPLLIFAPFAAVEQWPNALVVSLALGVTALAVLARQAATLVTWAQLAVATFALYTVTLLGVALPSLEKPWPAQEIKRAVAACGGPRPLWLVGLREPSAAFTLGTAKHYEDPPKLIAEDNRMHVVESRWMDEFQAAAAVRNLKPVEVTCIEAFNPVLACPVTFTVFAMEGDPPACQSPYRNACARVATRRRQNATSCR